MERGRSELGVQTERRRSAGGAQAVRLVLLCSTGDPCPAEDIKYLTRKALRQHWGSNMDNFPSAALRAIQQRGGVVINKKWHAWDPSWRADTVIVNYAGSGKYVSGLNYGVPWAELPESAGEGGAGEGGAGSSGSSSSGVQAPQQEAVGVGPTVGGWGWWPTIHIWIPGHHNGPSFSVWAQTTCGWTQLVVCVYQVMWDRPTAWWVDVVHPRSRM